MINKNLAQQAKNLIDDYMYTQENLQSIENFLKENTIYSETKIDPFGDHQKELSTRQKQNELITFFISSIDGHPCAELHEQTFPLRRLVWKCAGLNCDDFENLYIRKGVRFLNPQNITILTGGERVFLNGLHATSYLDGRGKILIYAPFTAAAGVKIFTHSHVFDDHSISHLDQGRKDYNCLIYPDCFAGEDAHLMGNLHLRTVVCGKTITSKNRIYPPYSIVGGIGKNYQLIKPLEKPPDFPPPYLKKMVEKINHYFPKYAQHLSKYLEIIKEYCQGTEWSLCQNRISQLEEKLL